MMPEEVHFGQGTQLYVSVLFLVARLSGLCALDI